MPRIENVSLSDIVNGFHMDVTKNSILIQIVDPDMDFPIPKKDFGKIHQFKFLDLEKDVDYGHHLKIVDEQAKAIAQILKDGLKENLDVVVHCIAGVCRSGAICEVGVILGYEDMYAYRSPNLMVKHKIMESLGLPYDPNEPFTVNGRPFKYDELNNKIWLDEE